MIPELGSFAIILAFCFALIQFIAPLWGYRQQNLFYVKFSVVAAIGQFLFLSFAMLCLIFSLLANDMTVAYVQAHSHQLLPLIYRIGAAWGGHEGSLLLWCLILAGWTVAFSLFSKKFPLVVMILGVISTGFIAFLLFTSNPFARLFLSAPIIGDDLPPVLQDPGLIFHPPMLYLGYVGFAIGFAFAITALIQGKLDKEWVQACRPWIILPWAFLSCGIVLGSWWAYRELGWGGWWFWDPVENASLLPWLAATALIHALLVSEKRDVFKGWTIFLAIITFALSLLGTFLVRSGILVSVHAFASDPSRGIFLLAYLTLIIGGAFIYYGYRIKHFFRPPTFQLCSRETFLLMNSVILLTAVATISIGTLYPIVLDVLDLGKISVGEPYFNTVFLPIILPLLLLMGFAPHVHWGQQSLKKLAQKVGINFIVTLIVAVSFPFISGFPFYWLTTLGIFFGLWIITATIQFSLKAQLSTKLSYLSMIIAHIGIGIMVLGITLNKSYSEERQVKMLPGETISIANNQFTLSSLNEIKGANYQSILATFTVREHHSIEILTAEQRIYRSHDQTLSHPGILVNIWRDLYLALGAPLPDGGWSVRIYVKPFVRWIWFGGLLLLVGGLLALITPRKKSQER
jgi:cytochrome c-type biogenesis protein CcmF